MTEEAPIKKFTTKCRTCIFATFDIDRQNGCQLGRLEPLGEQGRLVSSEDSGSFEVDGICTAARGTEWEEAQRMSGAQVNLIAQVEREIQITMDIVLYSVDETCDTLVNRVAKAVNSSAKQKRIMPKSIVIVVKSDKVSFSELYKTINDVITDYDIPFQLVKVVEDDADMGRSIELAIDKCKAQFVGVFDLSHAIPTNLIDNINDLVNYRMARFVMIAPMVKYSGMILTTNVFELLGKNYNFPIYEKIRMEAEEQDKHEFILTWEDVWNLK